MISVEDWAEIRRLHRAEQMPVRAIARKPGISRNTISKRDRDLAAPLTQQRLRRCNNFTFLEIWLHLAPAA